MPTIGSVGRGWGLSWLSIMALGRFGLSRGYGHCGQLSPQSPGQGMPGWRGETLAGTWWTLLPGLVQPTGLLLWAPSKVHTLLIHPLSLHSLDEAEEILIRHGGASGQHIRGWAALVINPGGLGRHSGD